LISEVVLIPLNDLILNGLIHGTRYGENGKVIHLNCKSGEVILFLKIDDAVCETRNRIIDFKEKLACMVDGAVCDLLVIYSKLNIYNKLFMLVEFKGDTEEQIKKAIRQILITYAYLSSELNHRLNKTSYGKIWWIGLVLSGGCSHKKFNQFLKKESKKLGYKRPPLPILPISKPIANDKVVRQTVNDYYRNIM